jgi:hypothetical protein
MHHHAKGASGSAGTSQNLLADDCSGVGSKTLLPRKQRAAGRPWRDLLPVHPAGELFPLMSPDELRALGKDIKTNGLRHPIIVWAPDADATGRRTVTRQRLPDRRLSESFELEVGGLRYTAAVSRFPDGRIGELFLNNHKSNSSADTNARDSAIVFSFAVQHGADPEAIQRALCRDSQGASGPLGVALDAIANEQRQGQR